MLPPPHEQCSLAPGAIVIGSAIGYGYLPICNSSSAFNVIAQEGVDGTEHYHLNQFESGIDAGTQYGSWEAKGAAAAIIDASGRLMKSNRGLTDWALREALGFYTV